MWGRAKYDWRAAILGCWTVRRGQFPHPPWLNKKAKPKAKESSVYSQAFWSWPDRRVESA